jgi:hypothetical protein
MDSVQGASSQPSRDQPSAYSGVRKLMDANHPVLSLR